MRGSYPKITICDDSKILARILAILLWWVPSLLKKVVLTWISLSFNTGNAEPCITDILPEEDVV